MEKENVNYSFLNYCTTYKVQGKDNFEKERDICFSTLFSSHNNNDFIKNSYSVLLEKRLRGVRSNFVLLNRKQIKNWLSYMKTFSNFTYKIHENKDRYRIELFINNYFIAHKFLLTMLRYLYEYPSNLCIRELYNMDISKKRSVEKLDLFNIIVATSSLMEYACHTIGYLYKFNKLINKQNFKKELNEEINIHQDLNNMLKESNIDHLCTKIKGNPYSEYWDDEKTFEKRKGIYIANYKRLKKEK